MRGTAWSHLPNAVHINRIVASIKSHPKSWSEAQDATYNAARIATYNAAWNAAGAAVRYAARYKALNAALDAAREADRFAAWDAAWGATAALVAWDDCAPYLDMPSDQLKVWAILSEKPSAILLLPAVIAFERIEDMETV